MPYGLGVAVIVAGMALVFGTFVYSLINARTTMALFRRASDGEIAAGPGKRGSKTGALISLILHFVGWGMAGFAWMYLLADTRASAPDSTPLENAGIVDGNTPATP